MTISPVTGHLATATPMPPIACGCGRRVDRSDPDHRRAIRLLGDELGEPDADLRMATFEVDDRVTEGSGRGPRVRRGQGAQRRERESGSALTVLEPLLLQTITQRSSVARPGNVHHVMVRPRRRTINQDIPKAPQS